MTTPKHPGGRPRGTRNKPGHQAGRPSKGVIDVTVTLPPALIEWLDTHEPKGNRSATVTRLLRDLQANHDTVNIRKELHMSKHTYEQTAEDYELWCEYVDPEGTMTEAEFDELSTEEKIQIQIKCFGKEEKVSDEE